MAQDNEGGKRIEIIRKELEALAQHILDRQDEILQTWIDAAERDPAISVTSQMTRAEFADHIPNLLETYCAALCAWPESETSDIVLAEKEQAVAHGAHRWQQGYDLKETTREWALFNRVMVEFLDSYGLAREGLHPQMLPQARQAMAQLVGAGIGSSIDEFARLQRIEAQARVNSLSAALSDVQVLERIRGAALREASHDLRGSLGVVQGAASLLDSPRLDESERAEMIRLIQSGTNTLHSMLSDMLDLARLESGNERRELRIFNVAEVLQELCDSLQIMAQEKGLYLCAQGPDSLQVEGDIVKIRRITQNLVLNALNYTDEGGVTLNWADHEGEQWTLLVQDSGAGFSAGAAASLQQELKSVTEDARSIHAQSGPETPMADAPDDTTTSQSEPVQHDMPAEQHPESPATVQQGEGVGLIIVKRLCELLNATIELDSKPGEGSMFRVVFPRRYDG